MDEILTKELERLKNINEKLQIKLNENSIETFNLDFIEKIQNNILTMCEIAKILKKQ